MTVSKPTVGQQNWGPALNAALDQLDAAVSAEATTRATADTAEATARAAAITAAATAASGTYIATAGVGSGDATGVTDRTTIQALLTAATAAGGGLVRGKPGQTYTLDTTLVIGSGTVLDMSGCTIAMKANANVNMLANTAYGTVQRTVTDAAITIGTATLTSATAAFTTADTGRTVVVTGAGYIKASSGTIGPLVAKMTYVNATTVTLSSNALHTVSGATAKVYARDTNISVIGGTWNPGNLGGGADGLTRNVMVFRHVDGLVVRGTRGTSTGATKFYVNPGDCNQVLIEDINVTSAADVVHVYGPAQGVTIRQISGSSGDDFVSVATWESADLFYDTGGPISDVVIDTLNPRSTSTNALTLFGDPSNAFRGVCVRDIGGTLTNTNTVVSMQGDGTAGGSISDVVIDGVWTATPVSATVVNCNMTANRVHVSNITATSPGTVINVGSVATIRSLILRNIDVLTGRTGNSPVVWIAGTLNDLLLDGFRVNLDGSSAVVYVASTAVVTNVRVSNGRLVQTGSGGIVDAQQTGATLTRVELRNLSLSSCAFILACAIAVKLHIYDVDTTSSGSFTIPTGGNLTIYGGSGCDLNSSSPSPVGTLRVIGPAMPMDVAKINGAVAGDTVYNTNTAALYSGNTLPMIYDGSKWRPVRGFVRANTSTLSGGTVTVADSNITANARIRVTTATPGGTQGAPYVSAVTAGVGFTISSTSASDTSVVYWEVVTY